MKDNVLFISKTTYQLLISFIINEYIKDKYNTYLISSSINENVDIMAEKLKGFKIIKTFSRLSGINNIKDYINNKKKLNNRLQVAKNISPDYLILFKDNDLLNSYLIDNLKNSKKVLLEEGIGIYNNEEVNSSFIRKIKHIIKRILKYPDPYKMNLGENKKIDILAVKKPELLSYKKRKNKKIVKMPKTIDRNLGLKFLDQINFDYYIKKYEKDILFLGQPLSEVGILTKKEEVKLLCNIKKIIENNKIELIIKPHPSENMKKYKIFRKKNIFYRNEISAELLPLFIDFSATITFNSSCAENIYNDYNIPPIYLYPIYKREKNFSKVGYKVNNFSEFKNAINYSIYNKEKYKNKLLNNYNYFVNKLFY